MNDEIRELRTYLSKEFNLKKRRPNVSNRKNGGLPMIQEEFSAWKLTIRELI